MSKYIGSTNSKKASAFNFDLCEVKTEILLILLHWCLYVGFWVKGFTNGIGFNIRPLWAYRRGLLTYDMNCMRSFLGIFKELSEKPNILLLLVWKFGLLMIKVNILEMFLSHLASLRSIWPLWPLRGQKLDINFFVNGCWTICLLGQGIKKWYPFFVLTLKRSRMTYSFFSSRVSKGQMLNTLTFERSKMKYFFFSS